MGIGPAWVLTCPVLSPVVTVVSRKPSMLQALSVAVPFTQPDTVSIKYPVVPV